MTGDAADPAAPRTLARDSLFVGLATVLTRLLGFARDIIIARLLGAGPVADAFLVAFRLPNLFRRVLGEGGLNAPFVPLYLAIKAEGGEAAARRFSGEAFAWFGILLGLITAVGTMFAPALVVAMAGGFRDAPVTFELATWYLTLALPFVAFTSVASLLSAMLNAEKRFVVASLAPALLNVVLLVGLGLAQIMGLDASRVAMTAAIAVTVGGVLHLALIAVTLASGRPGLPRPRLIWSPQMSRFTQLGLPALLAASTSQFVLLIATQIASVQPGAVSWLYYADRVFQLPLGFVAVAMGVVLLPEIAAQETAGDERGREATIDRALILGLAMAVPAATALAFLADPIISVLFEHGRFGIIDRQRTAAAMAAFALGLPFAVIAKVFAQVFFARQQPRLPLYAGLCALAVAAAAGQLLAGDRPARGAALAASMAFVAQSAVLFALLARDRLWLPHRTLLRPLLAVAAANAAMLLGLWLARHGLSDWLELDAGTVRRFAALALLCLGGIACYGATAHAIGAFRLRDLARPVRPA